jgi:hypothetical protein
MTSLVGGDGHGCNLTSEYYGTQNILFKTFAIYVDVMIIGSRYGDI